MLADRILSMAGTDIDKGVFGAAAEVAEKLKTAERFNFSVDAIGAAYQISRTRPSSILAALPLARAPFQTTWMEWEGHVPGAAEGGKDDPPVPRRFGVLLECLDETHQRVGASFFWYHDAAKESDRLTICPMGFVLSWHEKWPIVSRTQFLNPALARSDALRDLEKNFGKKICEDPAEVDAHLALNRRCVPTVAPHMHKCMRAIERKSFEFAERMMNTSADNLAGELHLLIGALCLLNSRNCVETETVDLTRLNRARSRRGKKPMLSYSTVTINLSARDRLAAKQAGMTQAEIRKHIVRGHFKIRSSGIFWWRPYIRGSEVFGEVKRSGYRVVDQVAA